MDFKVEGNQPLFKTLFHHSKAMSRRGCHRCAMEVSKLLLSLDSSDPMGIMFSIDYHGEFFPFPAFSPPDLISDRLLLFHFWLQPFGRGSTSLC